MLETYLTLCLLSVVAYTRIQNNVKSNCMGFGFPGYANYVISDVLSCVDSNLPWESEL